MAEITIDELAHAAEQGDADAQAQFGMLLINRHYFQIGIHFMLESISQTRNAEHIFYTHIAINNVKSEEEKRQILVELYERADANECTALYILGACFEDCCWIAEDYERSIYYYERSARCGFSSAMCKLGAYYLDMKNDTKEGMLWYFRAAEAGSDDAWLPIGKNIFMTQIMIDGITYDLQTEADIVQTLIYCAEKGDIIAQFLLARRYENGKGVPKDMLKAQYLYDKVKHYVKNLSEITNLIDGMMYVTHGYIPTY